MTAEGRAPSALMAIGCAHALRRLLPRLRASAVIVSRHAGSAHMTTSRAGGGARRLAEEVWLFAGADTCSAI